MIFTINMSKNVQMYILDTDHAIGLYICGVGPISGHQHSVYVRLYIYIIYLTFGGMAGVSVSMCT